VAAKLKLLKQHIKPQWIFCRVRTPGSYLRGRKQVVHVVQQRLVPAVRGRVARPIGLADVFVVVVVGSGEGVARLGCDRARFRRRFHDRRRGRSVVVADAAIARGRTVAVVAVVVAAAAAAVVFFKDRESTQITILDAR
jgi:hypothetical protein